MPISKIKGVHIQFPYEPYKVQVDYMSKVIECLQMGVNGILESPTGTGKTLSLLCSSLAWLEGKKAHQQLLIMQQNPLEELQDALKGLQSQIENATGGWSSTTNFMIPKVIYSSRTHAQLSQAIQELKRSSYSHVRAVVLGSRDQLCLHPEVSKLQNHTAKVYTCRSKISSRSCPFHLNVDEKVASQKEYVDNAVMDIEDLVRLGKKHTCCPYYATRTLKAKADMVFAPYNYIIDPKTRRAHGIELEGNIVILDEAHNVEGACEESMSFQLRSVDLAMCINEVTQTMEMVKGTDGQDFPVTDSAAPDFTMSDLSILKVMFCELEEHIDNEASKDSSDGIPKPGDYMIEILSRVELTPNKRDVILDLLDKIILYHSSSALSPWSSKGAGLQKFSDIVKILFSRQADQDSIKLKKEFTHKYRVYLQNEVVTKATSVQGWTATSSKKKSWKLDCWCFSPGIGMQNIVSTGTHSLILTSGTLSPLPPLICELGINFPVTLENPHIIANKQVFVGVITNGPDGTQLNSSYQNRFNDKYISSLGRTVSNFSRLIPDGVLVFFPSYTVLKGNVGKWEEMGIWQSMSGIKPVFTEPQGREAFQESIDQYYARINDPQGKGATLLAVCRGKVSEGLDFANKNARGVIITGLPFPPSMDPRVKMKMSYLDATARENKGLLGRDWYVLQASRAINQAIGRVIRHKDDYGAILLCDNRFSQRNIQSQLSQWVQGRIQIFNSFGPALKQLSAFFKEIEPIAIKPAVPDSRNASRMGAFIAGGDNAGKKSDLEVRSHSTNKRSASDTADIFHSYLNSQGNSQKPASSFLGKSQKPESVFDALEKFEQPTQQRCPLRIPSSSTQLEAANIPDVANRQAKKRKLNIQLVQAEPQNSSQSHDKSEHKEAWKKYLLEMKTLLGKSQLYARFCSCMKSYHTSRNVSLFALDMSAVFKDIPNRDKYLQKMSTLVSTQERAMFLALCLPK